MTRPVPTIQIDFGNGKIVKRTFRGNIASYVCFADGQIADVLPGIYEPATYQSALERILHFVASLKNEDERQRQEILRAYHARQQQRWWIAYFALISKILSDWLTNVLHPAEEVGQSQTSAKVRQWHELYQDTVKNEIVLRRQIHRMLAQLKTATPADFTRPLYKEVLHTDIDDPYLGLGQSLFGSYPFEK